MEDDTRQILIATNDKKEDSMDIDEVAHKTLVGRKKIKTISESPKISMSKSPNEKDRSNADKRKSTVSITTHSSAKKSKSTFNTPSKNGSKDKLVSNSARKISKESEKENSLHDADYEVVKDDVKERKNAEKAAEKMVKDQLKVLIYNE
jgi:hypothetical protein